MIERISCFFAFHPYKSIHTSWQALEIKMFSQINAKKNSYRAVKIKCPDKIIDSLLFVIIPR